MRRSLRLFAAAVLLFALSPARASPPPATPVPLPDGAPGIGFDDLQFSKSLGKVLAPAARSGKLDLIDPATLKIDSIGGFSAEATYDGGHDFGATSVDEGAGLLFVTDRTAQKLDLVDPKTRAIVSSAALAAGPDYVRFVPPAEIWVTEPDHAQIEIFTLHPGASAKSATVKNKVLELTKKEYELLLYFVSNKNRVISRNAIAEHLWGDDIQGSNDFIYTHIKNLRKKLIEAGKADYIKSIYGMGYKFSAQ